MIKYGIDSFTLLAPWSILVSILMFSGSAVIGRFALNHPKLKLVINQISNLSFQYPIFGFLTILLVIFPLILFEILSTDIIKVLSLFIICLNFYYLIFYKNFMSLFRNKFNKASVIDFYIILILIIGYFFLSLGPITSADSLDYQSSTAIHIVNFAEYPSKYHWFHSRTAGSGEVLIALGLALGAEQYGSLVQFSGLLSIVGLIINLCEKNYLHYKTTLFFILLFLIIPILVFLNSTNKPQLLPIALTSICFILTFIKSNNLNTQFKIYSYYIVVSLLISAFLLKYSFVLSGVLIGTYCLVNTINKKNILKLILITSILIILFFLPYSIWKYIKFEQNILYALFLALPEHLYGYSGFMESISSCGYSCLPVWFFLPRSLNEVTNFFGILFCFSFFIRIKNKSELIILLMIILYFVIGLLFGQSNPRFFFEPTLWFIFLLITSWKYDNYKIYKFFLKHIVRLQAFCIIIIIYFGIITLVPGSVSNNLRDKVLINNANGYSLLNWASKKLNNKDVLLSTHRSVAIPTIKTVPIFFVNYLNPKDTRSKIYYEEIKKEKPNYIIITENLEKYKNIFNSCLGELAFFKKNIHVIATRNPFIQGNMHDGFIYEFNYNNLPECVFDQN